MRKRTVWLMGPGATFDRRFAGQLMNVGENLPHPVWRYAYGMFLGVRV